MNDKLYNTREAAEFLGYSEVTVRRMVKSGKLAAHLDGPHFIFQHKDLAKIKGERYPEGMTHGDIAKEYVVKRTTVIAAFQRLGIQPSGVVRRRGAALISVYTPTTVAKLARILGWDRRHRSPQDESLPPADGSSQSGGEPSPDPQHDDPLSDRSDNGDHIPSSGGIHPS